MIMKRQRFDAAVLPARFEPVENWALALSVRIFASGFRFVPTRRNWQMR